jgi:6,7-dimethyl-8-ribityllumazine synthase
MTEHTDETHDWPLRDWSGRLRPPAGTDAQYPEDDGPVVELSETETQLEPETDVEEPEADAAEPAPAYGAAVEEAVAPVVDEHAEAELRVPDGYSVLEGVPDGQRRSVAIVVSRFNGEITNRLLDAALAELDEAGVARDAVLVMPVPGAFELPIAAMALAKTRRYSCVIALGCVIRGETPHFDFVASEAASGLQLAGIETGVPVSFGLLTCDTAEQAEARIDRGATAARTALEMADVFARLRATAAPR